MRRRVLVIAAGTGLAIAGLLTWLLGTGSGARFVLDRLLAVSPVSVEATGLAGTLAGPLTADSLSVRAPGLDLAARGLHLDWSPLTLLVGRMRLTSLHAESLRVEVTGQDGDESGPLPRVAWPVRLEDVRIDRADVSVNGERLLTGARLSLDGGVYGRRLSVERLDLEAPEAAVSGHATISADASDPWSVRLEWRLGEESGQPLRGRTVLDGRLGRLEFEQSLEGRVGASLAGRVNGLPRAARVEMTLELEPLPEGDDAWPSVLHGASASLAVSGALGAASVEGVLSMPVLAEGSVSVSGQGGWREGGLDIETLSLGFDNGGRATASGRVVPSANWAVDARIEGDTLGWPLGADAPMVPVPHIALQTRGDLTSYGFNASGRAGYDFLPISDIEVRGALEGPALVFSSVRMVDPGERLDIAGSGSLHLGEPRFGYRFDLSGSARLGPLPTAAGRLAGQGDTAGLVLDEVELETLDGTVQGRGRFGWDEGRTTDFSASVRDVDPAWFWAPARGALSGRVSLSGGGAGEPALAVAVEELGGTLRDQPVAGHARLALDDGRYRVPELDIRVGSSHLTGSAELGEALSLEASLLVGDAGELVAGAAGRLEAHLTAAGPPAAPRLSGRLEGRDLRAGDLVAASVNAEGNLDLNGEAPSSVTLTATEAGPAARPVDELEAGLQGRPGNHRFWLEARREGLHLNAGLRGGLTDTRWSGEVEMLALRDEAGDLAVLERTAPLMLAENAAEIDTVCLDGRLGRLCGQATWARDGPWSAGASLDALDLEALTRLADWPYLASGSLSGTVNIRREGDTFSDLSGHLDLGPGSIFDAAEPDLALHAWHSGRLDLEGNPQAVTLVLGIEPVDTGRLAGRVTLGWNDPELPLRGHAEAEVDALPVISELVPDVTAVTGRARSTIDLAGTLRAPEITGALVLEDGSAQVPALGLNPREIQARAEFTGRAVQLAMSAESGGGRVELDGAFDLADGGQPVGRVRMTGTDVLLVNMPQAQVYASPDLQFTYRSEELRIVGDVSIPTGRLTGLVDTGAVRPSPDEVIIGARQEEGAAVVARIQLTVGPDVVVDLHGLSGRLEGELLTIVDPPALPTGRGELRFLDGSLTVFGQRLEIERGALIYTGGPLENPALDITAVRDVQDIRAGARVRGTIREPTVALFSEPPMSRAETLSYLTTGKPISELRSGEGTDLNRAASSLALAGGSLVAGEVGERVGIDELGFEGDDETGNASLVIGKYLSPQLYVSYGVGLLEAVNVLKMRYRLSRRLSVEVATSDESSADIVYTFDRD